MAVWAVKMASSNKNALHKRSRSSDLFETIPRGFKNGKIEDFVFLCAPFKIPFWIGTVE
jgi:hypothetical protein